MSSRMLAAAWILVFTAACQETPTAPKHVSYASPNQNHPVMLAESPSLFSLYPGDDVPSPMVKIIQTGDGRALAGVTVTFTFGDGRVVIATTAADGNASANWPIDYTKSADSVVAKAEGVSGTMMFKALIVHDAAVATYELQSIGGHVLPITYSGGGTSWAITGGRYRVFSNGTYIFGYETNGQQRWGSALPYFRRDSTIEFYLSPGTAPQSLFYASINYLFSTATLHGGAMSVKYSDSIDFEDEIYVLKQ